VSEPATAERRVADRRDRRANSRSGRRKGDPRMNWRRIAWLFGAYAAYLSVRSIPASLKRLLRRDEVSNA
jgi:hypothetical protein